MFSSLISSIVVPAVSLLGYLLLLSPAIYFAVRWRENKLAVAADKQLALRTVLLFFQMVGVVLFAAGVFLLLLTLFAGNGELPARAGLGLLLSGGLCGGAAWLLEQRFCLKPAYRLAERGFLLALLFLFGLSGAGGVTALLVGLVTGAGLIVGAALSVTGGSLFAAVFHRYQQCVK